jgi:hypothetical protein
MMPLAAAAAPMLGASLGLRCDSSFRSHDAACQPYTSLSAIEHRTDGLDYWCRFAGSV